MTCRDATPLLVVSDIPRAVSFMEHVLGFKAEVQQDTYAYLVNGTAAIRLLFAGEGVDLSDPKRQQSCYIDVTDTDAYYAEHRAALDALPEKCFRAPFNQDYGQRELHVIFESILFFIGSAITEDTGT